MSTSTSASASASSAEPNTKTKPSILGGDYAGLSATFSSKSGELVPVPEHLVPESMLEWGDIPSSLEALSSEDLNEDTGELERTTITVLPEVGCGIDNLEVTKKTEKFGSGVTRLLSWGQGHPEREVAVLDRRQGRRLDLDTIFQLDSEVDDEDGEAGTRRVRVSLSIDIPKESEDPVLSKLITLQVERQSSSESSQGTAWSGPSSNSGGLDARTVMNTIGKGIVYGDIFAVKKLKACGEQWDLPGDGTGEGGTSLDVLEGTWILTMGSPTKEDGVKVHRPKEDFVSEGTSSVTTLRLPQNTMVRYGNGLSSSEADKWVIEVSHFGTINTAGQTKVQRRVVSRTIDATMLEEEGVSSSGDVSHFLEEKFVD